MTNFHKNGVSKCGSAPAWYNKLLGMTNNIPSPRNSYVEKNLDIMKPTYRKHIWSVPWPFIISRFHCVYIISSVVELLNYDKIKPPWLNFFISYYYSFLRILQKKIRIRYWIYLWPLLGKGYAQAFHLPSFPRRRENPGNEVDNSLSLTFASA